MADISPIKANLNVDTAETIKAGGGFVDTVCKMFGLGQYSSKRQKDQARTIIEVAQLGIEEERALVERAKVRAIGMAEVAAILEAGGLNPTSSSGRAIQSEIHQAEWKQANRDAVWELAEPMLTDDAKSGASDASHDQDKVFSIFERFSRVSTNEMQLIWAKILAGELNKPESFSNSTLEIVSKLSRSDAEDFLRVCSYVILLGGSPVPLLHNIVSENYRRQNFEPELLWNLERLGLLNYRPEAKGRYIEAFNDVAIAVWQGSRGFRMEFAKGQRFFYGEVYFTRPGMELSGVCNAIPQANVLEEARLYWSTSARSLSEICPYPDSPAFQGCLRHGFRL